jgi:hypothetical protein
VIVFAFALALATQTYALDAPRAEGLWLSSSVGAGYVAGDVVIGASVGAGFELDPFALHIDVPLTLRVVDLAPGVPPTTSPAACKYVRCEEWTDAGEISLDAASRVVEELRVLHPGDPVHLKGGRLFATLGHGQHLARYTNAAEWDRRGSGLYLEGNVPVARTRIDALAARLFAPQDLFGARIASSPLDAAAGADDVTRFLSRMRLGVEMAGDAFAPVGADAVDANGSIFPDAARRTIAGGAVDVAWPLLDESEGAGVQVEPWISASTMTGLLDRAGGTPGVGGGGSAGLDVTVDAIFVAVRLAARGTLDTTRHRSTLFGTLYDIDRKRVLDASGGFAPFGIADLPASGGAGGGGSAEVVVMRAVRAGARMHVDPVVQGTELETFAEVGIGPVAVGARALQRALRGPGDAFAFGERTFVVAEAAWAVWAPVSLFARWRHAPRFDAARGGLVVDDDVFAGASLDIVFQ